MRGRVIEEGENPTEYCWTVCAIEERMNKCDRGEREERRDEEEMIEEGT